jgi:hypothetical protein
MFRRMHRLLALAAVVAVGVAPAVAGPASASHAGRSCTTRSKWLVTWEQTFAGHVRRPTAVFHRPGTHPFARLPVADPYNFPTTVSLLERRWICGVSWYRVRVAMWPNGTTGWVRSKAITTVRLQLRIVVDRSQHRLYLFRRGRIVLRSPAAVGKPSTPTPLGTFFVTQRFIVNPSTGPWGPRALGISAFSDVLRSWRDGGPIGIHGTNETFSIGQPVSHGCVRLPNALIKRLFAITPLGTPVLIRP